MKFKDKDGNVFEDIDTARDRFCPCPCVKCVMSSWNNGHGTRCAVYCRDHPAEAARLMGYEVVEDAASERKEGTL